jgi:hypothetical protein
MEHIEASEHENVDEEINPIIYLTNKRELKKLYHKSGIYEYWEKDNEWEYHQLFEYTNSCYEGLKNELGIRKTYIYFPETEALIADCDSFETHNYIQLSTGMFKKFLEIPTTMTGVYHALPGLFVLYNSGKIPSAEKLIFILGVHGLIFHEIGHAVQFKGPRQYSDEVKSLKADKAPLTREKVIEHHLSEWDADNFSAVLSCYQALEYVEAVESEELIAPILDELVVLSMLGKFLVHNALSGDTFDLYYLENRHPCTPMRITNYCSRITSFFEILGYKINEGYCVNMFAGILNEFGKGEAWSSFMTAMKSSAGNEYYEIIEEERKKADANRAFVKIIDYATKIELAKRSASGKLD